jgi:hypothetical protein
VLEIGGGQYPEKMSMPTTMQNPIATLESERKQLAIRVDNELNYLAGKGRKTSELLKLLQGRQQGLFDPGYIPENDADRMHFFERFNTGRFNQAKGLLEKYRDATVSTEAYELKRRFLYVLYSVLGQGVLPIPEDL